MDYEYEIVPDYITVEIPGGYEIHEPLMTTVYTGIYNHNTSTLIKDDPPIYCKFVGNTCISLIPTTFYSWFETDMTEIHPIILTGSTIVDTSSTKWTEYIMLIYAQSSIVFETLETYYSPNYLHIKIAPDKSNEIILFYYGINNISNSLDYYSGIEKFATNLIWIINGPATYEMFDNVEFGLYYAIYNNIDKLPGENMGVFTFKIINEKYYLIRSSIPIYTVTNNICKLVNSDNPVLLSTLVENKFGITAYINLEGILNIMDHPFIPWILDITAEDILSKKYNEPQKCFWKNK